MEDTIAAISTPIGQGGIAIVRLSGPQSLSIADQIFLSSRGKPSSFVTHTLQHGTIFEDGTIIDEVLLAVMRGPKTYTAEDVVEINCHGGIVVARRVLAACLHHGARGAEPGEFTQRAFLNGKLDLAQAESVMDVITANTDLAQAGAINVLTGKFSHRVSAISGKLLNILAHLEAHLDFPEEDITPDTMDHLHKEGVKILGEIRQLMTATKEGKVLRHGVRVAIVGKPNVGKSSLLNALLEEDRAIVTPHAGTTRDTLEETANIRGIPVHFIDTAGIRKTDRAIENYGIERSYKALNESDLAILVLDGSKRLEEVDKEIAARTVKNRTICVISKTDLPVKMKLPANFQHQERIQISIPNRIGIDELKSTVEKFIWNGVPPRTENCLSINERHEEALRRTHSSLTHSIDLMENGVGIEIIAQGIRISLDHLGEISGKTTPEDILKQVFSRFCIGK